MTTTKSLKNILIDLNACEDAREWVADKTLEEAWNACHRSDWMLWLYRRAKNYDLQTLTLAKGHCANTVRHLMKDKRSINAVDVAIQFGEGNATRDELDAAAYAAAYAADAAAAYAAAAAADAYADAAAAAAADAYADAAYAADAADAYAADAAAAYAAAAAAAAAYAAAAADVLKANQKATADICRKYLPLPIL